MTDNFPLIALLEGERDQVTKEEGREKFWQPR